MIQREKSFKIGEKTFTVKFPNVGQLIDLESLKQALTNNRYGAMASSGVVSMYDALDMVDAISFFQVCCPDVARHFDIKSYTALTTEKLTDLLNAYKEEIKPWFNEVSKSLKEVGLEEK